LGHAAFLKAIGKSTTMLSNADCEGWVCATDTAQLQNLSGPEARQNIRSLYVIDAPKLTTRNGVAPVDLKAGSGPACDGDPAQAPDCLGLFHFENMAGSPR
jgi:hypothetical protein